MKKLLILFLLLFTLTACSPENTGTPTPTQYFYDLTFRENIGYDLENGNPIYTDYMSTARQKISSGGLFIRNADFSPDVNAHHVLFWSKNNYYLGYQNFPSTDYEGDRYLGDISTVEITLPEHADKFSIIASKMSTSELIPHELTLNSIVSDTNLSYQTLFNGVGLQSEQLITNGNFDTDLDGWLPSIYQATWVNGRAYFNRPAEGPLVNLSQTLPNLDNKKVYISLEVEKIVDNATGTYGMYNNNGNPNVLQNFRELPIGKSTVSKVVDILTTGTLYFNSHSDGTEYYIDNVILFDIQELITNKQYSPLYNTTFDLMTDEQIKLQMDYWVENGLTPKLATLMKTYNLSETSILNHYHTYLRLLEKTDVTLEELYLEPDYELPSPLFDFSPFSFPTIPDYRSSNGRDNVTYPIAFGLLPEKEYVLMFEYYTQPPRIDVVNEYVDIYDTNNNLLYDNVGKFVIDPILSNYSVILSTGFITNDTTNEMVNFYVPMGVGEVIDDSNQISNISGLTYLKDPVLNMGSKGFEVYNSPNGTYYSMNLPYVDLGVLSTDTLSQIKTKIIGWLEQANVELNFRLVPKIYELKGLIHINETTIELNEGTNVFGVRPSDDITLELNSGQPNGAINEGIYDISELENTGILNYPNYTYLSLEDKVIFIDYWGVLDFEYLSQVSLLNSTYEYVKANIDGWISRYELIDSYTELNYTEFQETESYYILDVYPPVPSNTSGFLNDQLEEWGLNTSLFKTLMIVLFMIVTSIILAIFGAKQSVLILANTLVLILFAVLGWISMWLFIPIILIAGTFIVLKFTNSGGGTEV